ncbi:hypothetical protein JQC67_09955 [Aurantibacter crassamenti]|uniref:hypothetical protein n=1 Tax=Aurantibacter crassamenti TaxID=1837375 RepID=UPI001939EBD7|nr:hypothetical protein [Aurantibacter crassamenti]MBM1106461.1 hypothetical protein [Aurantibacter crassamenti]
MNKSIFYKITTLLLCFISLGVYGQNQSKTYKESFNVSNDAVIEINTSHADIEFETWGKNEVVIEATIELSEISEDEAERYFENNPIMIMGNSQKIEVTSEGNMAFNSNLFSNLNFHFEMPEMPEVSEIIELIEFEEMPPLPNANFHKFDHEAYKKDGEVYMKKWQKEFSKGFDKDYEKKIEEWGKRMEERAERLQQRRIEHAERIEARAERLEERAEQRQELQEQRQELHVQRNERAKQRAEISRQRGSTQNMFIHNDSMSTGSSNIFNFRKNRGEGNFKIKKTIKIKMPKSVKLKMNIKHGEVKLAENTKNLNATLSHARLQAKTIDGEDTTIIASYSPISVQYWNVGELESNYSEQVLLNEVGNLNLNSTSSEITINHLLQSLKATNNFGPIHIESISNNFKNIDVALQNAELILQLPNTSFSINVKSENSKLTKPSSLSLSKTENNGVVQNKGHHLNMNDDKKIQITSKYSEVILQ